MSGDCDLLNDMSDIHDEQPEELRGEHPSEVQDDEQEESLHKTIEELTDGMKITNDNPITYGEYKAAENDPNHPLHDPDNPLHEQYLQAAESFRETNASIAGVLRDTGVFENTKFLRPFGVEKALESYGNFGFNADYFLERYRGMVPKIDPIESFGVTPKDFGVSTDSLGLKPEDFSISKPEFGTASDYCSNLVDQWWEEAEAQRWAMDESMEAIQAERQRKEQEEKDFRERVTFALNRLADIQESMEGRAKKDREEDLEAQEKQHRKDIFRVNWQFWAVFIVALLTFGATLWG